MRNRCMVTLRHCLSVRFEGIYGNETFQVLSELVFEPGKSRIRGVLHKKLFTFIKLIVN